MVGTLSAMVSKLATMCNALTFQHNTSENSKPPNPIATVVESTQQ